MLEEWNAGKMKLFVSNVWNFCAFRLFAAALFPPERSERGPAAFLVGQPLNPNVAKHKKVESRIIKSQFYGLFTEVRLVIEKSSWLSFP